MKGLNKRSLVLCIVLVFVSSLQVADLASANYLPPPSIEISSPISVRIYNEPSVQLYVRVNALPSESSNINYISYCLDGKANVTLTDITRKNGESYWTQTPGVMVAGNAFTVNCTLDNLSVGKHSLTVYSHAADGKEMSRTIEFTVDLTYTPPQTPFGDSLNHTSTQPPVQTPVAIPTGTPAPPVGSDILSLVGDSVPTVLVFVVVVVVVAVLVMVLYRKEWKSRN